MDVEHQVCIEMQEWYEQQYDIPDTCVHLYEVRGIELNKTGYTRDIGHDEFKKSGLTIEQAINLFDEWMELADIVSMHRCTDGITSLEWRAGEQVKGRLLAVWEAWLDFHQGKTTTSYYDWQMKQAIGIGGWLNIDTPPPE